MPGLPEAPISYPSYDLSSLEPSITSFRSHSQSLEQTLVDAETARQLRNKDLPTPEQELALGKDWFDWLKQFKGEDLYEISQDNSFSRTITLATQFINIHIMSSWQRGEDVSGVLTEATELYRRLNRPLESEKAAYLGAFVELNKAIVLPPQEAEPIVKKVCNRFVRARLNLENHTGTTGLLPTEEFYRNKYELPSSFGNAYAQSLLEFAFISLRLPENDESFASLIIGYAQEVLSQELERLKLLDKSNNQETKRYRESLVIQRRKGALLSNLAYSYLLASQAELQRENPDSMLFVRQMAKFRENFESFLRIFDLNPEILQGSKKEDKEKMRKDFNTEVHLRLLFGSAIYWQARSRFPNLTAKRIQEEEKFFRLVMRRFSSEDKYHGLPSYRQLLGLIKKNLLPMTEKTFNDPSDRAEYDKYTNWLAEILPPTNSKN